MSLSADQPSGDWLIPDWLSLECLSADWLVDDRLSGDWLIPDWLSLSVLVLIGQLLTD